MISGHEKLFFSGVLHRDVSIGNILICPKDGVPDNTRGCIIDFDRAKKTPKQVSPPHMGSVDESAVQMCIAVIGMEFKGKKTIDRDVAVKLVARYDSPYRQLAHVIHVLDIWPYPETQDTIEVNLGYLLRDEMLTD